MPSKSTGLGPVVTDIDGVELSDVDREVLTHPKLGGIIFFSRNYESREQLTALTRCIRELAPQLILSVDQEGGRVQRFRQGFTRLPSMSMLGQFFLDSPTEAEILARDIAWLLATELSELDIDHSYAPVLDLDKNRSRVIGDRAFSDQAETVIALGLAFIEGMNEGGMAATAKHFPGHGGVIEDSHVALPQDQRPLADVQKKDLLPFKQLVSSYAAVMTAHIAYPQVDTVPVSFSRKWINEVLRETLGFKGVVFSDDLSMKGAAGDSDDIIPIEDRALKAIEAGCDGVLICNDRKHAEKSLEFLERKQLGSGEKLSAMKRGLPQHGKHTNDVERHKRVRAALDALHSSYST